MESIEQILITNGFEAKEAKVYLCVLEMGEMPISRIAQKTHLKRSTVYVVVDALKLKGCLGTSTKNGILYVSPVSPKIIVDKLKQSVKMAEEVLPDLLNIAYASPLKPRIRFFDGVDGIKQVLKEFSYSKVQSMGFTDYEQMPTDLVSFIRSEIIPERMKNKNCAQFIVPDNLVNRGVVALDKENFTEHRIAKFQIQKNPIELLLFGQSELGFLSFVKDEMFGVIIDSKAIHDTLKNIFIFIWSISEPKRI